MSTQEPARLVTIKLTPVGRAETYLLDGPATIRPGDAVVVQTEGGPAVGTVVRNRGPVAGDLRDLRSQARGQVQPVNAFLEKCVAARHAFVVAPVAGGFQAPGDGGEVGEHHLADHAVCQQPAQCDRQRLVMIVLANQHHAPAPLARLAHGLVIGHRRKRRLLHQHVLAGGERLQREVQVKFRRNRNHDGVDVRIVDRGVVIGITARAAELAAECGGLRLVAAGIAEDDLGAQAPEVAAMDARDEAAAEKSDAEGRRHRVPQ